MADDTRDEILAAFETALETQLRAIRRLRLKLATDLREDTAHGPRLVLARDHYGIKPLYYARSTSGRVVFASAHVRNLRAP